MVKHKEFSMGISRDCRAICLSLFGALERTGDYALSPSTQYLAAARYWSRHRLTVSFY
jgi:hypothetical protein